MTATVTYELRLLHGKLDAIELAWLGSSLDHIFGNPIIPQIKPITCATLGKFKIINMMLIY